MRDRLRLPLHFDPEPIQREVERLGRDAWVAHFVKGNYEGTWDAIPLRAQAGARHAIDTIYSNPAASEFTDTPVLAASPYLQQVLATFRCPLQAVRLMRLRAGSAIRPHADHDLALEFGHARLHIPVATNPDVDFRLNGERVVMNEGECWYLQLSETHSVVNGGDTDRVHLVIDAVVNPWLESLLREADQMPAAENRSAPTDLQRFQALVTADASLQQELLGVDDVRAFIALAVRVAASRGLRITEHDVEHAMRETQRTWPERLA